MVELIKEACENTENIGEATGLENPDDEGIVQENVVEAECLESRYSLSQHLTASCSNGKNFTDKNRLRHLKKVKELSIVDVGSKCRHWVDYWLAIPSDTDVLFNQEDLKDRIMWSNSPYFFFVKCSLGACPLVPYELLNQIRFATGQCRNSQEDVPEARRQFVMQSYPKQRNHSWLREHWKPSASIQKKKPAQWCSA